MWTSMRLDLAYRIVVTEELPIRGNVVDARVTELTASRLIGHWLLHGQGRNALIGIGKSSTWSR